MTKKYFETKSLFKDLKSFCSEAKNKQNSLHELGNVTGVIISSSTCSDIMTYNVYFVFMQINFTETEKTQVRMTSSKKF